MNQNMQQIATKRATVGSHWLVTSLLIAAISLTACVSNQTTSASAQASTSATDAPAASADSAATTGTSVETTAPVSADATAEDSPAEEASPAQTKLNLNTATSEEFMTIPDMGNRMVREFEEYRPYVSIQQFRREIGKYVDEAQVAEYEKYVFVPVSPNESDAETLAQLPGVDEATAEALIAGRPYTSNDEFLAKLGESVSADDLAAAAGYLAAE